MILKFIIVPYVGYVVKPIDKSATEIDYRNELVNGFAKFGLFPKFSKDLNFFINGFDEEYWCIDDCSIEGTLADGYPVLFFLREDIKYPKREAVNNAILESKSINFE